MGTYISITLSEIKDGLLFILALYGAVLSTFNWRQAVRKERRQVKVVISMMMPVYPNFGICNTFVKLEAINVGHRPVTVTTLKLELPSGRCMFPTDAHALPGMPNSTLPVSLADGESAYMSISCSGIGSTLLGNGHSGKVKLIPVCLDSAGGIYRGKAWDVDPHEFLKM